ncbi:hypothetical protein N24_1843 [Corynebacterium suranareeae]|uniref:Uncharacterized protein n=1 Tax=Corynebacterium suranareeae TaxID=2506452 RepID=A0A160PRD1_9CORY|nr:hypothetical protein [Corynebacterium suranareeae]BAU96105.1 hypothetical protein N24_1843 [Corynebacterium suranareeae]
MTTASPLKPKNSLNGAQTTFVHNCITDGPTELKNTIDARGGIEQLRDNEISQLPDKLWFNSATSTSNDEFTTDDARLALLYNMALNKALAHRNELAARWYAIVNPQTSQEASHKRIASWHLTQLHALVTLSRTLGIIIPGDEIDTVAQSMEKARQAGTENWSTVAMRTYVINHKASK